MLEFILLVQIQIGFWYALVNIMKSTSKKSKKTSDNVL